jgi:hypothetical protein
MGARHVIQLGEQHRRGNLVGSSGVPGSTGRNQSRLEAFASGVEAELHAQAPSHRLEAFASVCSVTDTTERKNAMVPLPPVPILRSHSLSLLSSSLPPRYFRPPHRRRAHRRPSTVRAQIRPSPCPRRASPAELRARRHKLHARGREAPAAAHAGPPRTGAPMRRRAGAEARRSSALPATTTSHAAAADPAGPHLLHPCASVDLRPC